MGGGGERYAQMERGMAKPGAVKPEEFLLDVRKERIEEILTQRTRTLTVVLDRLEDSFNMAAVLRTSESMGLQEVHILENPDVPFVPHTKVTQGCDKWLDIHRYRSFAPCRDALKARGFAIWASGIREGGRSLYSLKFDQKIALVFGNERRGVATEILDAADGVFWIPMRGFTQSLNISAAVSASLTRAVAWRDEHLGKSGDLSAEELTELRARFQLLSVKQRKKIYGGTPKTSGT
jgi:tRNA (guanosine-2'-O-)-methyltransferase